MPFRNWLGRRHAGPDERRRAPRCSATHLSLVQGVDLLGEGQYQAMGRTRNLSEGGTLIELPRELPAGTWVEISLGIGERVLETRGKVLSCQWVDGEGYLLRVSFRRLDHPARELLRDYVRGRVSQQTTPATVQFIEI